MIHFVNIKKEEFLRSKLLYKHMPLENALRTLENKYLWFADPCEWKDPFEKRFLEAKYTQKGKNVNLRWRDKLFCTCMTQTISSEAFWNTYSKGNIGVELRISRSQLLEELSRYEDKYKIFIGRAEYLNTKDITCKDLRKIPFNPAVPADLKTNSDEFAARLFLLKRVSFSYENEIRIIIVSDEPSSAKGIELKYLCDNTELIHSVVLDPNIEDYTFNMLKGHFENAFGFIKTEQNGKKRQRVLRSRLYAKQRTAILNLD